MQNKPSKSKAEITECNAAIPRVAQALKDSHPDIITRMESMPPQLMQRTVFPSILKSAEDERRERDRDLEYESRLDYESWQYDGPAEREDV